MKSKGLKMDFTMHGYIRSIRQTLSRDYKQMYRPPGQRMKYPFLNWGFQNWNYLVLNMIAWLEGRQVIEEF